MLGVYDFCGHYEWTFAWIERRGGRKALLEYWDKAIHRDSQRHAAELIGKKGVDGMMEYWGHSLSQEAAGYKTTTDGKVFRIDILDCPSKGFLMRNGLEQHSDYCDHCMGWIGPMLKDAGFIIDHEHNHKGLCWWEMRAVEDASRPGAPGAFSGGSDARLQPGWNCPGSRIDRYERAGDPDAKQP